MTVFLCSDCFRNAGLQYEARRLGQLNSNLCPNCKSTRGAKLRAEDLVVLRDRFFRHATAPHGIGGYHVPVLEINDADAPDDEIDMPEDSHADWLTLKSVIGGRLFYNAPALWKLGITEHYDDNAEVSPATISKIIQQLSTKTIEPQSSFFRIRVNIRKDLLFDPNQFDAPPTDPRWSVRSIMDRLRGRKRKYGRFDDDSNPVMYTSPSLSVCLHECRVLLTDDIYVGTLTPRRPLRLADLTASYVQEPRTPFEDLTHFFNGAVLSRTTYDTCRLISKTIKSQLDLDGFVYRSFFTTVLDGPALNYAIFGYPIDDGRVRLCSINAVRLDQVDYAYSLGPVLGADAG